jgi:drug/metabolite transporter (DMT)-like permease
VLAAVVVVAAGRRAAPAGRIPRRELVVLGVAGVMGLVLNLSIFAAFARVTVAIAVLGFYTYPAMVAVIAIALGRERPSGAIVGALLLALGGLAVVVLGGLDAGAVSIDPVGVLLALTAAAAQTVFVTISRDGYPSVRADVAMSAILAVSAIGAAAVAVAAAGGPGIFLRPLDTPALLPVVVAAGVFAAGIPSLMFLVAIRRIGGTRTGILMLLEPVVALGLAALLLGEALRPVQLVGAVAILGAALLLQRSAAPADEAPLQPAPGGP